jgi:hypothetical protein
MHVCKVPYKQRRVEIKSGAGINNVNTPYKSQKHSRPDYACNLRLAAMLWFQTRDSGQTAPQVSAAGGIARLPPSAWLCGQGRHSGAGLTCHGV